MHNTHTPSERERARERERERECESERERESERARKTETQPQPDAQTPTPPPPHTHIHPHIHPHKQSHQPGDVFCCSCPPPDTIPPCPISVSRIASQGRSTIRCHRAGHHIGRVCHGHLSVRLIA
eukprot:1418874-Rhodomonas_salina.1